VCASSWCLTMRETSLSEKLRTLFLT
jgi:hypothetical protein